LRGGGRARRRARRIRGGLSSLRSPLTALIVAISLLAQLFAVAAQPALAAPAFSAAHAAAVAADLKAVFGDTAYLCAHIDDQGAPSPHAPGHCCDQCPLCRFAAQAVAFVPPDAPALPERLGADCRTIGAAPDFGAWPAAPTQPNHARAPPLAV